MKILSAAQIREADQATIQNEPISSTDLMERAATACFDWLMHHEPFLALTQAGHSVHVFCGPGNNGGDGLVMARLLHEKEIPVTVFGLDLNGKYSNDYQVNAERLKSLEVSIQPITTEKEFPSLPPGAIIIDALFGTGLSRPLEGIPGKLIDHINAAPSSMVVAIDVPSGLFSEENTDLRRRAIVRAHHTLSFEVPKLALLFPENAPFVGEWTLLPIGLDPEYMAQAPTDYWYVIKSVVAHRLPARPKFGHKGTFGRVLLAGGSLGKMGAMVMAARSCLRSGNGLLTVEVPQCGVNILQTADPEAMVVANEGQDHLMGKLTLQDYSAIGIGPGMGTEPAAQTLLKLLIQEYGGGLVVDADALNILGENKTWLSFLPAGAILTPHFKEFERLAGPAKDDFDRIQLLRAFAQKYRVYVVLKGAHTAIASPAGQVFFNSTGNSGMAKGGSGDVLTGLLTGLLGQGISPLSACLLGVYLHGLAGDVAADRLTPETMTALDLVDDLSHAFRFLRA